MGGDEAAQSRAACAAADVHPLLCAVAHRTGDLSLLREEFAPDQAQLLVPGCGLGPGADVRGACAGGRRPVGPPGLGPAGPCADAGGTPAHLRVPGRLRRGRALGGVLERGARARRHRPAPTFVAHRRPRRRVSLRRHRRGRLGPGGGAPPAPGRCGGHGVREERRRRRDVARERVPGLPGRRAQPALQLLLRADQRLGLPLLGPARPAGLPPVDGKGSAGWGSASGSGAR